MVFISHLDVMRVFDRAVRRAGLPFCLTKGFNPHPKISLKRALALGKSSENEEVSFFMEERLDESYFLRRMNEQLPEGLVLLKVNDIT